MNWRIGQEIVCIKSHSWGAVKEGKVYTIKGIRKACCHVQLDVGIQSDIKEYYCKRCFTSYEDNNIWWIADFLFSPLEYDQNAIEELLENTLVKTN